MVRKPEGIGETEDLLRKLIQVPKRELDRELAKRIVKLQRKESKSKKRAAKRKKKS